MSNLAKKSLVLDPKLLDQLMRLGEYRNASEAVRDAVARTLAIRQMQDAVADLRRGGRFGHRLR